MEQLGQPSTARHRSALGAWERTWQRPSRPLRGLVGGYTGYRQRLTAPATHRGLPTPVLPLVVSFGPPQTISATHAGSVTVHSFLAGLHDRYVLIDADEHHGVQVDLTPIGAHRLLGRPLRELTGAVVPLDALLGPDAGRLVDDLATARDWPARFRVLDGFLRARMTAGAAPPREVARAWARIGASGGRVRVGELPAEVGWSERHLSARFGETLGLSPKRMARLARLEHATALLERLAAGGLAEVAVTAGYYDQAHLTNDVRALTGLSPRELLARRLPDSGGVFDPRGA